MTEFLKFLKRFHFSPLAYLGLFFLLACTHPFEDLQKTLPDLKFPKLEFKEEHLSNGLSVFLIEDHGAPLISYQTWVRGGSADDTLPMSGMAHLFEHLLFKGTPRYPARKLFEELEMQGAEVNALTTRDYTLFYETFPPNLLEKVIDIESDRLTHLELSEELLRVEKRIIFEERKLHFGSMEFRMEEALWQMAFARHPYQWPIMGIPFILESIDLSQAQSFYQTKYHPNNVGIVITGDFKISEASSLIRKYYGVIPSAKKLAVEPVAPDLEQNEERRLVLREAVEEERVALAYHIPEAGHPDAFALDLFSLLAFEGSSSRGVKTLIEEKKIASELSASSYTPRYPGLFLIQAVLRRGKSLNLFESELEKLFRSFQKEKVTPLELKDATQRLKWQWLESIQTARGLGQWVGSFFGIYGDLKQLPREWKRYEEMTPDDIQRVANRYFDPNHRTVVSVQAPENKK